MYHNDNIILKTLKHQDFLLWLKLVDIYYKGYHTISEGKFIFDAIKLHMNKHRLTTNSHLFKDKKFISTFRPRPKGHGPRPRGERNR